MRTLLRPRQAGVSLVELMVGIALGLFIVAAALLTSVGHLADNRRLLLETQVQQDLRASADIVTRDLRRAGYWAAAANGVWTAGATSLQSNPYIGIASVEPGAQSDKVVFSYSLDADKNLDENHSVDIHDQAGFRLRNGAIELQLGAGNWQQLTDPAVLRITALRIELQVQTIALDAVCLKPCGDECPVQEVREVEVGIHGEAVHDASVSRSLQTRVRLPNDVVRGACPV
jgi:type IV pilus assembly protein PilW